MSRFYMPPGNVTGRSLLIALAAAAVSSAAAPLYAALTLYVHWISVSAVLLFCYGMLTGLAAGAATRATRTLSPAAAAALALAGGWAGFAVSWAAWAGLVSQSGGAAFPGIREVAVYLASPSRWGALLADPGRILDVAGELGRHGLWKLSGSEEPLRGIPYCGLWIGEFLIFSLCAAGDAFSSARAPYSFEARAFLREEVPLPSGAALPVDPDLRREAAEAIRAGDLGYLAAAPPAGPGEPGLFVTFRSHALSPWGTASVEQSDRKGWRRRSRELARDVLLSDRTMDILRRRLS
ncbi:MAG: hypothetical protein LBT40_01930 [Deltaproteobacteria bacterium]|jgi:hypothetical protein|nr:hypothetical protein [Deltaproteobacteria bacterium]